MMKQGRARAGRIALLLLTGLLGCAVSAPRPEKMISVPREARRVGPLPYAIAVAEDPTYPEREAFGDAVFRSDFAAAVAASLRRSRLFRHVLERRPGELDLLVTVLEVDCGEAASRDGARGCILWAEWKLLRNQGGGEILFHQAIAARGEAGYDPRAAAVGARAREAAARRNIATGLRKLAGLGL